MPAGLFEDGKDPQAFRTIGEVSAALDIKPHVLRYWEEQFPMLRPVKRSGGRRYYRPDDVELLQAIDRLLNHDGYTIRGAVKAIEDGGREAGRKPAIVAEATTPVTAPEVVEQHGGAFGTLEDGAGSGEPVLADRRREYVHLQARLRAIREKLASALIS